MTENRYAPPKAKLVEADLSDDAPALWNPNAAANWSLLLTPAFGAYLHMRNWEALGEPDKAAGSRNWIYITLGVFTLSIIAGFGAVIGFFFIVGILLGVLVAFRRPS